MQKIDLFIRVDIFTIYESAYLVIFANKFIDKITNIYFEKRMSDPNTSSSYAQGYGSKNTTSTRADIWQSSANDYIYNLAPSPFKSTLNASYNFLSNKNTRPSYDERRGQNARPSFNQVNNNGRKKQTVSREDGSVFTATNLTNMVRPDLSVVQLAPSVVQVIPPQPRQPPRDLSSTIENKYQNLPPDISKTTPLRFAGDQKGPSQVPPSTKGQFTNQQLEVIEKFKKIYKTQNPQELVQAVSQKLDSLGLKYNKNDIHQVIELGQIVCQILKHPDEEKAEVHRQANMLGTIDIGEFKNQELKICECCNLAEQGELPLSTSLESIKYLGISNHMYFLSIQNFRLLMWILLVFFSLFAIGTNLKSSFLYKQQLNGKDVIASLKSYSGIVATSIGSKQLLRNEFTAATSTIQCWLGLITIVIWIGAFVYISYKHLEKESKVDFQSVTITDYTLLFKNVPRNIQLNDLQNQLTDYQYEMRRKYPEHFPDFPQLMQTEIKVEKINRVAPFYLDDSIYDNPDLKSVNELYRSYKQTYAKLIIERKTSPIFSKSKDQMKELLKKFANIQSQRIKKYEDFARKLIIEKKQNTDSKRLLDIFVTFSNTQNKQLLQRLHERQSSFLYNLPCFGKRDYFSLKNLENKQKDTAERLPVIIEPAVEPEDIKWLSLSRSPSQIIALNVISFVVTAVLLCISFFIILALSGLKQSQKNTKDLVSYILSLVISGVVPGINFVISIILNALTKLQRNESYTHEQNSIGFKTVVASLINCILIPIAMAFYKANIFGIEGLADDIFFIALSNAFLPSFLAFVNPAYWVARVMYWWKTRGDKKFDLCQKQLNILNEKVQFQLGTSYASIITLYLFTCFFVSMQPIIVVFAIIGLYLHQHACRYCLYKTCKRPIPGNNHINNRKYLFFLLGPIFYSLGSLFATTWVGGNEIDSTPNILAIVLATICFLLPYKEMCKLFPNKFYDYRRGTYKADKNLFPSEYDQSNPLTSNIRRLSKQNVEQKYRHRLNKRQQNLGGVSVSNNSDKLKIAELFQDIDEVAIDTSSMQASSHLQDNRYSPIKITVNEKPLAAYYNQQTNGSRMSTALPTMRVNQPIVYLQGGHSVHQPMAHQGERIYVIQHSN